MTRETLIKYFFGSIIILFIFWNRFLRDRENVSPSLIPKELLIISNIVVLIFFIVGLYINIKIVTKNNKRSKLITKLLQYPVIQKTLDYLREYISKSPVFLYEDLTKNWDLVFIEKPASYFTVYCYYPRLIVIVFLELPLLIVAAAFLLSNVYFHDLTIFFKSLIILIPMLLMRVWLFSVMSYSNRRLKHLYEFLNVTYIKKSREFKLQLKPDNQLPISPEFPLDQIKFKFNVLCAFWEIYSSIYTFMKDIESFRNRYDPYIQIITSTFYIIGWFYILFIIILG